MPIDFDRVPPKVSVPHAPQPSPALWILLLAIAVCVGTVSTVLLIPGGNTTNPVWFWLCAIGYPILIWAFSLFTFLAYGNTARASALAKNRVSDNAESACHVAASKPMEIYGFGWYFSSNEKENSLRAVIDGSVQVTLRPSAAHRDKEVLARWIDVPDEPFYPGNELTEYLRHLAVSEWLVDRLLEDFSPELSALPAGSTLHVHLCLHSKLENRRVTDRLSGLLKKAGVVHFRIACEEAIPIFAADTWMDQRDENAFHLVIAIELRDAISETLVGGVAEVGVALLLGHARLKKSVSNNALCLHRPVKTSMDKIADGVGLATRWADANTKELGSVWVNGLQDEALGIARNVTKIDEQAQWKSIESSVGDCSASGGWLAVALAAANADSGRSPQLVLAQEGGALTALVCREKRD